MFQTDKQFTGQQREGDLYFMKSRFYDPLVGRFLQPDSIVPDYANPQSLNRYSYVMNNPLGYTDPTGHSACLPTVGGRCIGRPPGGDTGGPQYTDGGTYIGNGCSPHCPSVCVYNCHSPLDDGPSSVVSDDDGTSIVPILIGVLDTGIYTGTRTGNPWVAAGTTAIVVGGLCYAYCDDAVYGLTSVGGKIIEGLTTMFAGGNPPKYRGDPRTARQILAEEKKGYVSGEFPSEWKPKTFDEIDRAAKQNLPNAKKARKLLTDSKYDKGTKR